MGSFGIIVKIENMRKLMEENDSLSALKVLETINLKKIKNLSDLSLIAEIYSQNAKYEEAYDLLLKIYEKSKTRKTLFQLICAAIECNNETEAESLLAQYSEMAPKDFYNYIFRYKIDKLKGEPYNKLIDTLQKLKKEEYIEKWAYELAKLYYKTGMDKECINECSDIILWFGQGKYVEKARMLRSYFTGEKDKEKMIEELKKRAGSFDNMTKENGNYNGSSIQDNSAVEQENIKNENPEQEDVTEDITASLKNEIVNIMADESQDKYDQDETGDNETSEENAAEEETHEEYIQEEAAEEESYEEVTGEKVSEGERYEEASEKEAAEEETHEEYIQEEAAKEESYEKVTGEEAAEEGMTEEDPTEEMAWKDDMESMDEGESHGLMELSEISSELDLDLEEIFRDFLDDGAVISQILDKRDLLFNVEKKGLQLVVTSSEDVDKMSFAKGIAILLKKTGRLSTSRIAKITADKLNNIHLANKKEKLQGCCVIVENASELKKATVEQVQKLIKSLHGDISVIYEEDSRKADLLFLGVPDRQNILKLQIRL